MYQHFGNAGTLSLTLSQDDYWHSSLQRRQYQLQYNAQLPHNVSLNLFASQSLTSSRSNDRLIGLGITLPLDLAHASSATFDLQHSAGKSNERASLSGHFDERRLNYRATLANDTRQSGSLSLGYQGKPCQLRHGLQRGLRLSQPVTEHQRRPAGARRRHAVGTVHRRNQRRGACAGYRRDRCQPGQQGKTNGDGYALAPYMRPYRANPVVLELDQLDPEIEIDNGATQVVPRRGAVVLAQFAARRVNRLVLTLLQADGRPLPFGAQVSDEHGQNWR